jgi:hypothetical protein
MNQEDFIKTSIYESILRNKRNDPYDNSSFKVLKELSSRSKGSWMEKTFEIIAKSYGFKVTKAMNSNHDRICQNKKIEIKGSFLWENSQSFRWQQIRVEQDYDYVVFLAFYPSEVKCFYASKQEVTNNLVIQNSKGEWIYNQHGGKKVNSGTFQMHGEPKDYPWLKEFASNTVL